MSASQTHTLLQGCHARIRRTLGGLAALAAPGASADPRAPATAEACRRYLRQGLPLHSQDEDHSLAPRLRARADLPEATRAALETMEQEHEAIEDTLVPVLGALDRLARGEAAALDPAPLDRLLRTHLEAEEALIFPQLALLSPAEHQAIVREIRQRRAGP